MIEIYIYIYNSVHVYIYIYIAAAGNIYRVIYIEEYIKRNIDIVTNVDRVRYIESRVWARERVCRDLCHARCSD